MLIIGPKEQREHSVALTDGQYVPVERSRWIETGPAELAKHIEWP